MNSKYVLGIYATRENKYFVDLGYSKVEYNSRLIVDKSVIDFLEMHDVRITEFGDRVYIVNAIEYINLGEYKDAE